MSKRHVRLLQRVLEAVLADYLQEFPYDRNEVERDKSRIASLIENRGLTVLTVDFPEMLKHFDKCLSGCAYTPSGLPGNRPFKRGAVIPRLFREILLRIFDESGMLRPDADVFAVATIRQLYAVGKKLRLDCKKEKVYETISDFYRIEDDLKAPTLKGWDQEVLDLTRIDRCHLDNYRCRGSLFGDISPGDYEPDSSFTRTCQLVADIVSGTLGRFEPSEWRPKHGPGAVSEAKRGVSYKYDFQSWPEKLEPIFPYATFAFANESIWADHVQTTGGADGKDLPSRLICVPKTQKGPRLIAAEPSAYQFCQQAIWSYLEGRVHRTWLSRFIRFRDQRFNQEGARLGSISGNWTVDLSAASDRISLRLVERIFRRNLSLLLALHACRTSVLTQSICSKETESVVLRKFSTMGSACTFPVQSLVFLVLSLGCVLYARNQKPSPDRIRALAGEIRIFGDDIVIPEDGGHFLLKLLPWLELKANDAKTHVSGNFRESCGMDVFKGFDVTPSYVLDLADSSKPESIVSTVSASNNFFRRGWWHAAEAIQSTVPSGTPIPLVAVDSGAFGWTTNSKLALKDYDVVRWNDTLHRWEAKVATVKTIAPKLQVEGNGPLLQYFTEKPDPGQPWKSGFVSRTAIKIRSRWVELGHLASSEAGRPALSAM